MAERIKPSADKQKKQNALWEGIRGVVERYTRRQLIAIVVLNLLFASGVVAGVWYYLGQRKKATQVQLNTEDPYAKNIRRLEQENLPKDPLKQAIYYSQIAQNYETLKLYDKAIEYYKKAQAPIDEYNLHDELAFYSAIAGVYVAKKDPREAKAFYQKELDRLAGYRQRHPDDPGAAEVIKEIQGKMSIL